MWLSATWPRCWDPNPGPVKEQFVFLATEPSLRSPIFLFNMFPGPLLCVPMTDETLGHHTIKTPLLHCSQCASPLHSSADQPSREQNSVTGLTIRLLSTSLLPCRRFGNFPLPVILFFPIPWAEQCEIYLHRWLPSFWSFTPLLSQLSWL